MRIKLLQLRRRYYRYRLQHKDLPVFLREYVEKFLYLDLKQPVLPCAGPEVTSERGE